jgi:hypothetical protein
LQNDKKSLEYSKDDIRLNPFQHLLEIKTWGTKWKRVIDKTNEWTTWQLVNAKNVFKKSLLKQAINIYKEYMEDYNLVMFTHAMDFFKKRVSLKKLIITCSYDVNIQSHI